jgi:hypothetical protein
MTTECLESNVTMPTHKAHGAAREPERISSRVAMRAGSMDWAWQRRSMKLNCGAEIANTASSSVSRRDRA